MGLWLALLLGMGGEPSDPAPPPAGLLSPAAAAEAFPVVAQISPAIVSFGVGSGFLISASGYILTNHHVAEAFGGWGVVHRGQVAPHPGEPLEVVQIAAYPAADLALYRAYTDHALPYLRLREAAPVEGEAVVMVSHPDRGAQRASLGHILSAPRLVGGVPSVAHSAAWSWGSSGAPLVDVQGEVVAIHWASVEGTRGASAVGVPVDVIRALRWIRRP